MWIHHFTLSPTTRHLWQKWQIEIKIVNFFVFQGVGLSTSKTKPGPWTNSRSFLCSITTSHQEHFTFFFQQKINMTPSRAFLVSIGYSPLLATNFLLQLYVAFSFIFYLYFAFQNLLSSTPSTLLISQVTILKTLHVGMTVVARLSS